MLKQAIHILLLIILFLGLIVPNQAQTDVLVQFHQNAIPRLFQQELSLNHNIEFQLEPIALDWHIYRLTSLHKPSIEFIDSLKALPYLLNVQENHQNIELRSTPNDDDFIAQWYLQNNGLAPGGGSADINATKAWNITTGGTTALGEPIAVAVIDGGFFLNHEDINFAVNTHEIPNNQIDDDQNGFTDDYLGWNAFLQNDSIYNSSHGTHVAGILGAQGNNNKGISGINWNIELVPICGATSTESIVVEAYYYAYQLKKQYLNSGGTKGRNIVATNGSFGVSMANPADYPIWCAIYDSLLNLGILNVVAAPNNNVNVDLVGDIPCSCPSNSIISVTATNSTDTKLPNAGFGKKTIDIAAPGEQIHATIPFNDYGTKSGTSMATPMVTGAIGLMHAAACQNLALNYQQMPKETALYFKSKLLRFGVDPSEQLSELLVSGGRLNLFTAVQSVTENNCAELHVQIDSISCYNACDGAITVQSFGLKEPIQYSWENSTANTNRIENLCQNKYAVTATDADGLSKAVQVYLPQPDSIDYQLIIYPETDLLNNGSIELIPQNSSEILEVAFGSTQNTYSLTNLKSNTYSYIITGFDSCVFARSVQVPFESSTVKTANYFKVIHPTESALYLELRYTPQVLGSFDFVLVSSSGMVIENWQQVNLTNQESLQLRLKTKLSSGLYILYMNSKNKRIDSYKFLYMKS